MIYAKTASRIRGTFFLVLFTLLFTACAGSSASGSTTSPTPVATATPSPTPGITFQQFTTTGFTLQYPIDWQKKQSKALAGKQPIYSFVAADNTTGFHVELHSIYFDADTPIIDLFGAQMDSGTNCKQGDTSLPETTTINGKSWYQNDMLCQVPGGTYEIRTFLSKNDTHNQVYIAYGAYQKMSATSEGFARISKTIFEPMLLSFKLS